MAINNIKLLSFVTADQIVDIISFWNESHLIELLFIV